MKPHSVGIPMKEPEESLQLKNIENAGQQEIDRMAEIAQKQAEKTFQEILKPILNIVDTTEDLETLRASLKDEKNVKKLYEQMDSPDLEDVLHQSMYLAELIGRSEE